MLMHVIWTLKLSYFTLLHFIIHKGTSIELCWNVRVQPPAVILGMSSSITGSCIIERQEYCLNRMSNASEIIWKLDGEEIAKNQYNSLNGTSYVTIPNFNKTRGVLACYVVLHGSQQLVGQASIQAGYPPSKPTDLVCITNVSSLITMTCKWTPGNNTYLPTTYKLQRARLVSLLGTLESLNDCIAEAEKNYCTLKREFLILYQSVYTWVSATNALGSVQSDRKQLDPMDVVKLDAPIISEANSSQAGCIQVKQQERVSWLKQRCELRYKLTGRQEWHLAESSTAETFPAIELCGLHSGMKYLVQTRCIKKSGLGYWSEWSTEKNVTVLEKAPTGKLNTFWKETVNKLKEEKEIWLLWKPMEILEANGEIQKYLVYIPKKNDEDTETVLCSTANTNCTFFVHVSVQRVYIKAINSAGESPATEVLLCKISGRPLRNIQVSPKDDYTLLLTWQVPRFPVTYYIIEWFMLPNKMPREITWQLAMYNDTQALLQENIKPLTRYNISLYPLYKDGLGDPVSTKVYSRQGAPSKAPELKAKNMKKSQVELIWDNIPEDECNGFLKSYTVIWNDMKGNSISAVIDASENSYVVKNLDAYSQYYILITATTDAGSINGTVLTINTPYFGDGDLISLVLPCCLILFLVSVVITLMCYNCNTVKTHFWPTVPDPSNSSLRKWMPSQFHEEKKQMSEVLDPSIALLESNNDTKLSHAEVMEKSEDHSPKHCASSKHSFPESLPYGTSSITKKPRSYVNTDRTVEYATVTVDSYRVQTPPPPPYSRSNSLQPLLNDLPPSPKPYENMWFQIFSDQDTCFQKAHKTVRANDESAWKTFPLLWELQIEGNDDQDITHGISAYPGTRFSDSQPVAQNIFVSHSSN
ncbi:granulocyte colony-stimulating factor receptor [Protopterus annectens]|uniref:granulocyte colony-stimulating factor receptor n=1 Tax=Protopterus annectens TaxID=7888 RepID=UPI001CFA3625|nr:granulocyte colony-stimulating factor receptor [Protopterus annectens]